MQDLVLILTGTHRDEALERRAGRILRVHGELEPSDIAWLRQRGTPVLVAGPGAVETVSRLATYAIAAEVAEPAGPIDGIEAVEDITDLVGRTPLLRLARLYPDAVTVLGKLESFNPGGSTKDRVALSLVDSAERDGRLRPGGHIVEPTSGNTGVGLAIVAARRGYRCTFTVPDKVAPEKIALLRAYGAEVLVCPTNVAAEDERSYYSVAARVAAQDPEAFRPDQYSNPANPAAHERTTGPEIWEQTSGQVTHLVAGAGTGGTLSGTGRFLKRMNPAIKVIAADPVGSVYSGGNGEPYLVEGIGEDFWPANWDSGLVDEVIQISDAESFAWTRRAARVEGVLLGGSCGAALAAAERVAATAPAGSVIVVILPDGGRGYLSKLYDDDWMLLHGFLREENAGPLVADVLEQVREHRPGLVHVHPEEMVRTAAMVMAQYRIESIPVLTTEDPRVPAQVAGSVSARHLAERLSRGFEKIGNGEPPLPFIGTGESLQRVIARLDGASCAVVLHEGRPTGLLTLGELLSATPKS